MRCEICNRFSTACICQQPIQRGLEGIGTDSYPSQGSEPTSIAAYHSVDSIRAESRRVVYEVIVNQAADGLAGATQDEVGETTGKPPNSVWPRFKELEADGYIFKGELRRETRTGRAAIVWEPRSIAPEAVSPLPGQERLL